MKYSDVMATLPRLLTARDAEDYVAGETMLRILKTEHGLKPIQQGNRLTTYDRHDIDAAIEKLKKASV